MLVAWLTSRSLSFHADLLRLSSTNNSPDLWNRPASTVANANRNKNKLGADMVIKPGGGAIELKLGYNGSDHYDDAINMDVDQHRFRFVGSWRFYPLSYVFIESTFDMLDYPNAETDSVVLLEITEPLHLRASAGVSGYFTERSPSFFASDTAILPGGAGCGPDT